MSKTVCLINDTSYCHAGSVAVVQRISEVLMSQGYVLYKVPTNSQVDFNKMSECVAVVMNGEGTCHHGAAEHFLLAMSKAQSQGIPTYLINTLWQDMPAKWAPVIQKMDGVCVREELSARHMKERHGRRPTVIPDFSYHATLTEEPSLDFKGGLVYGSWFVHQKQPYSEAYLAAQQWRMGLSKSRSWSKIVRSLGTASIYLTGLHHGVYAACKARCIFIPFWRSCYKITGLFQSAGVSIPIPISAAGIQEAIDWIPQHRDDYNRLFDWLEEQPAWGGIS